ncbi:MAG: hypothetical protein F6K35_19550 [Okeania sp. SIO2H7]|uniref:hypothetical protein n=2 Tax=Okeania TaxID=1458928 RepID=UPI0013B87138|nr:hypothetical protein [Okeania sp. SIO2G5]NEP41301.1 hypothetical protein [Okeania sp. SIO2H7]NEP96108.1 hypothetical protein [Okeania sp. SIO2F5]
MLKTFPIDTTRNINPLSNNFRVNNFNRYTVAIPDDEMTESEFLQLSTMPSCIRLDLENLKSFEVVDHQFKNWGLTFSNAIAIEPSNPAFAVPPGVKVLMGAPKSGLIEIHFKSPVKFVSGVVTSSRRTVLSAYNQNEELLAKDETSASNLLNSNSHISPNAQLTVNAQNIHKVSFYAFEGQLIVVDLKFGF